MSLKILQNTRRSIEHIATYNDIELKDMNTYREPEQLFYAKSRCTEIIFLWTMT